MMILSACTTKAVSPAIGVATSLSLTRQTEMTPSQFVTVTVSNTTLGPTVQFPGSQFAWFYKPPESGDLDALASQYDLFILTRMDEKERDYIQSLTTGPLFLQYLLFSEIQDPGSCTDQPNHNQVAELTGDFCELESNHPDWFLRDANGQVVQNDDGYVLMDPGNSKWRAYWLQRAQDAQALYGWQGVFLDNVEASLEKRTRYGAIPASYPDDASYQAAILDNLRFLYTHHFQPNGIPLFANIISANDPAVWLQYLQYLDGGMLENFAVGWSDDTLSPEEWEAQCALAEQSQSLGKAIILVSQGAESDQERQLFAFASYLLVNNGKAFFRYAHHSSYSQNWTFENYDFDLGKPLGPRYKKDGVWMRDFEKGRVRVNPHSVTALIEKK